ncbi:MAG: thioredoxin family protein [Solirubrobacterales bacterium]|nr:thioredoxin family protein [Solirubrobacterales bacterium]
MSIELGDRAPGFELPGTDGADHPLEAGGAKATVVYWTCNHCPYALAWHDRLLDVARDYADRGVRVLAVNSNDPDRYPADSFEAMSERVEGEGGWPHPFLHDASQEVAQAWGAEKTPHVFVLDGDLSLRYEGAPDSDHDDPSLGAEWLREALDAVLAGEQPERSRTPAVGCGVKWKP